jgi:hypothetical protein
VVGEEGIQDISLGKCSRSNCQNLVYTPVLVYTNFGVYGRFCPIPGKSEASGQTFIHSNKYNRKWAPGPSWAFFRDIHPVSSNQAPIGDFNPPRAHVGHF